MDEFKASDFFRFVVENNVYGFFDTPIKLKSGRMSHFYANWRTVTSDVFSADILADYVTAFVNHHSIAADTFYGVPEGATKLGILTQYKWARQSPDFKKGSHTLAMGRAKPKDHGDPKDRFFVGIPQGRVVVIEDVTTTGGSLYNTLIHLQESGVHISAVISLTNRMEKRDDGLSVAEFIGGLNLPFYSMSEAPDVLPLVYEKLQPGPSIGRAVEKEFEEYGVRPLKIM